jgi:hypothetical protein
LVVPDELLETVVEFHDADRAVPILRFEVALPEVDGFQDVAVGVDGAPGRNPADVFGLGHGRILLDGSYHSE